MFTLRYNGEVKKFKNHAAAISYVQERNQSLAELTEYGA